DWIFTSAAAAAVGLDDVVVPIDPALFGDDPTAAIVLTYALRTDGGSQRFFSDWVLFAGVPEPALPGLAASALVLVLLRGLTRRGALRPRATSAAARSAPARAGSRRARRRS